MKRLMFIPLLFLIMSVGYTATEGEIEKSENESNNVSMENPLNLS